MGSTCPVSGGHSLFSPKPTEFVGAWIHRRPSNQHLELRVIRVTNKQVTQQFVTLDAANAPFGRACGLVEDHDVYIGVCPRLRPQGRAEDVTHAPRFCPDLDLRSFADGEARALRKLADLPIKPTGIIATNWGPPVLETEEVVRWDAGMAGRLQAA